MASLRPAKGKGMVCAVGVLVFRIHGCRSLKEKRSVVRSLVARLKNHFNASVAEVACQDVYQRAEIGFSLVGNEVAHVNAMADTLVRMAEDYTSAELLDSDFEIFHYSEF
ncbi:DUF503 domain-containing protein [Desulfobotulus sp.]|jgi:uncharacterized protein YlxP (DUF503 family)|uniref:DUF503 domain-containing protein n=1 Tax=Desulfobotulus sp. TaxID=1940337 RepID=UPI002A36AD68|nr:DUF503 domain-containing protein [Desulfobotulus sp.]MDY0164173.1 DUF503 domain-containing protein [Desulfobotulus sp.]